MHRESCPGLGFPADDACPGFTRRGRAGRTHVLPYRPARGPRQRLRAERLSRLNPHNDNEGSRDEGRLHDDADLGIARCGNAGRRLAVRRRSAAGDLELAAARDCTAPAAPSAAPTSAARTPAAARTTAARAAAPGPAATSAAWTPAAAPAARATAAGIAGGRVPPRGVQPLLRHQHRRRDRELDNGTFAGWARTGQVVQRRIRRPNGVRRPSAASSRRLFAPKSSHFYTATRPNARACEQHGLGRSRPRRSGCSPRMLDGGCPHGHEGRLSPVQQRLRAPRRTIATRPTRRCAPT